MDARKKEAKKDRQVECWLNARVRMKMEHEDILPKVGAEQL